MTARMAISVGCGEEPDGWICTVFVGDDPGRTTHEVTVARDDLERLAPGAVEPSDLVRASFDFLLAREPRDSILRAFSLPVIGKYFPGYPAEIGRTVAGRQAPAGS